MTEHLEELTDYEAICPFCIGEVEALYTPGRFRCLSCSSEFKNRGPGQEHCG